MNVNQPAVDRARRLIEQNQYMLESDWSEAQPSPDEENDQLDRHGWSGFAEWFLAIDSDASEETKGRYKFPYGDFRRVHRDGLIAAKQRAAQNDYTDVEAAADELLALLDETKA